MSDRSISRRDLLAAAAVAPFAATLGCSSSRESALGQGNSPPAEVRRPKHLFVIVSDDHSRGDLGCYGNPDCPTPHLDRFAAQGARFDNGYTVVAVCKPSRSALYTGLYPHKNGATGFKPVRDDVATWCELLRPDACATGMIGKLNVAPAEKFQFESWVRSKKVGDTRDADLVAGALRAMLDGFGERRAAVVVNLKDPHRPFREPLTSEDPDAPVPHDPAKLALPASFHDTPETRQELANYYDRVWRLDRTVGALLGVLDERDLAKDSLVVFTSDNGRPFPFAKTTLYEAGINLPFLVRWPGVVAPGTVQGAFVNVIDLLPTALDAFGIEAPGPLDGRSLLPLLRGEAASVRAEMVAMHTEHRVGEPTPARSIRVGNLKYIRNFAVDSEFESNVIDRSLTWRSWTREARENPALRERMARFVRRPPEELFDLERDPLELADLVASPEHAETLATMRARLQEWMRVSGDPLRDA
jgi:N-sulfoglucosamine sulfohydrolase